MATCLREALRRRQGTLLAAFFNFPVLAEREASTIFPWMIDPNCFTSLGEGSSPFVTISELDALGRR
jgi:hypothetical protein